jgi:DNA-binding response OmpR family regulator
MLDLPVDYNDGALVKGMDLDALEIRSSSQRALIVDDDPDTVDLIKIIIQNAGMDVFGAFSGYEALQKCANLHPNIILLDLMMPGMDGWETYHGIRKMTSAPVIVVSAITKKEQVVRGLQMGCDDYVTKPFFPPELVARVQTVLRRAGGPSPVTVRVFPEVGLTIDSESHDVKLNEDLVQLTPREFSVLEVLARSAPRMVRYEEIAVDIWDDDSAKIRNRIKYLIYLLRHKLERDPNNPQLILNREGLGYQLNIEP